MEYILSILNTEYSLFLWLTMSFMAIVGLLSSIKGFVEFIEWFRKFKSTKAKNFDIAKRATLKSVLGIVIIGAVWPVGSKLLKSYKNNRKSILVSPNGNLVANRKSGIIHLKNVGSGFLPSKKWETYELDLIKHRPYSADERRIYEEIGLQAIKQKNDFIAIEAYILAIKASPLSFHLYDKLTRIYGRQKKYTEILQLHENALVSLAQLNLSKRLRKRAEKEFSMRVKRTKHRSLMA